jgi:hypothetical protein
MGLERGPLTLVSTIQALLGRRRDFGLESREYGRRDTSRGPCGTSYTQNDGTNFADKWQVQLCRGLRPRSFFI